MRGDNTRQMGECRHMIERGGNFGRTPETVIHHAAHPIGVCGAGTRDAGNLFAQRTGMGRVGARGIEVIKRRCGVAQSGHRGGKTGLMSGVVGGHQQIGLGQVLQVHEGIGTLQP